MGGFKDLLQQIQYSSRAINLRVHARIAHRHSPREQTLKSVMVTSGKLLTKSFDEIVLFSVICWSKPDKTISPTRTKIELHDVAAIFIKYEAPVFSCTEIECHTIIAVL